MDIEIKKHAEERSAFSRMKSQRNSECVDEILAKYSETVYRLALARVKSRIDAEDIFQEVFLRYFQKEREFEGEEHRKAWLIRVTIILTKKFWAKKWHRDVPLSDTFRVSMPREESEVCRAVFALPLKYRTVVWLFYFEELSVAEIAKTLDLKESTVRSQLTRTRAMLREKLKGDYFCE